MEEGTSYCAGVSGSDKNSPSKFTCTNEATEFSSTTGYIWLCGLNPSKDYYYFMYTESDGVKSPLIRSVEKFGQLRAVIGWVQPVHGACAIDVYVQLEYDPLLGPKAYRMVVNRELGGKVTLMQGTNDPMEEDEDTATFRIPAFDGAEYTINSQVFAGKINKATDEAVFAFYNPRFCKDIPKGGANVVDGIYYYYSSAIPSVNPPPGPNGGGCAKGNSCSKGKANNPKGNSNNNPGKLLICLLLKNAIAWNPILSSPMIGWINSRHVFGFWIFLKMCCRQGWQALGLNVSVTRFQTSMKASITSTPRIHLTF